MSGSPIRVSMLAALVVAAGGCGDDAVPVFPENYADTYTEVRDCRPNGGSHDFNYIRVVADPAALVAYRDRSELFPAGSVILKEEYDDNDPTCAGEIAKWSAMQRLPDGSQDMLGWRWQRVEPGHVVATEDEPRCFGCHADCIPPDGYEGTCTVP